jgi:hypothetical protein
MELRRPKEQAATKVTEVKLSPGSECIVKRESGAVVRGRFVQMTADQFELNVGAVDVPWHRRIAHADIVLVAKVIPRRRRTRLGAAIGALVSLPLSISMFGDMMVPAAIAGGLIGYHTGESRADIVFERQPLPQ